MKVAKKNPLLVTVSLNVFIVAIRMLAVSVPFIVQSVVALINELNLFFFLCIPLPS